MDALFAEDLLNHVNIAFLPCKQTGSVESVYRQDSGLVV